ncbi:MAG: hypothetical protein QOE77_2146 [Blastocatellia bacterium]|jgi:hypothetical protein|nr:hypothetical protein [Blastocatellia bacterium]
MTRGPSSNDRMTNEKWKMSFSFNDPLRANLLPLLLAKGLSGKS